MTETETGHLSLVGGRRLVAAVRPRGFGAGAAGRYGRAFDGRNLLAQRLRVDEDRGGAGPGHPAAVGLPGHRPRVAGRAGKRYDIIISSGLSVRRSVGVG